MKSKKKYRDKVRERLSKVRALLLADPKRLEDLLRRIGVDKHEIHDRVEAVQLLLERDVPALLDELDSPFATETPLTGDARRLYTIYIDNGGSTIYNAKSWQEAKEFAETDGHKVVSVRIPSEKVFWESQNNKPQESES